MQAVHFRFVVRILPVLALFAAVAGAQEPATPAPPKSERHVFEIARFAFESGATVPNVKVVYGTYGRLSAARDNVILLPSHYMADYHGYERWIGPGRALDPEQYFLIATELFGNGKSSSPSNTPEPFHGPRFPVATIRDNVEAVHQLLLDLGITHVRAVIGFSMGAEQAFQWAVSYPELMDRIVATSGTAKCWPHGVVRLEAEISAIELDPAFKGGDYTVQPQRGVELFALVWTGWLFSQEWWRQERWREIAPPGTTLDAFVAARKKSFIPGADANDLILQARTWERHDVGKTKGFDGNVEKALASIKVPVLYMPSETDLYFPVTDARYEARFIPHVTLTPIPSLWGHPAGIGVDAADKAFLNEKIAAFLH
jgi:homoserine O-acetyltransferase